MSEHSSTQSYDDMDTPRLLMTGVVGVIAVVVIVVWLRAMYYVQEDHIETQRLTSEPSAAAVQKEQWQEALGSYGKVDEEKKIVPVPIDRAMKAYVQERQAN